MIFSFLVLLVGFQIKHFLADYLLQPGWMLQGKGSIAAAGGYIHAGVHSACSAIVLVVAGVPPGLTAVLAVAEFVVHYLLDFSKIRYSAGVDEAREPAKYWGMFGFDQLMHQLTYAAMIYFALSELMEIPA
ncbi:MAG TPA: DUF3307 domain-containing protein [Devosiaceae bacterium]|nr:DUF3307 domain-containing protein [Devosiaceae bacterium]